MFVLKSIIFKIPIISNLILKTRSSMIKRAFLESSLGEINLCESIFLGKIVKSINNTGPMIEIGTFLGESTRVIVSNKSPEHELITIDNYVWNPLRLTSNDHFQITQNILYEAINKYNVKVLNIDKKDFYSKYSGKTPSLVFLDANHTYNETKKDILWAKHINAGLICGHDYNEEKHPGVVKAVNDFGKPKQLVESLWVL